MALLDQVKLRKPATGATPTTEVSAPPDPASTVVIEAPPVSKSKAVQKYGGTHDHRRPNKAEVSLHGVFGLAQNKSEQALFDGVAKQRLCSGERFPPELARQIEAIVGIPITRSGLTEAYAACLPNAHVEANASLREGGVKFHILFRDHLGVQIGEATRILERHADGSLEMHRQGFWVEPELRGQATAAHAMKIEEELLSTLSDHPRTRMTLRAGTAHGQKMGPYVWANFGFDYAHLHDATSEVARYPERDSTGRLGTAGSSSFSDLELAKRFYPEWVDEMTKAGHLPNDPELRNALEAAAKHFRHPWEIASFRIEGLKIPVTMAGKTVECDIGKAFLLWQHAPKWDGVYFVNHAGTGNEIAKAYVERSIGEANEKQRIKEDAIAKVLAGDDRDAQRAALTELGRYGGQPWLAPLKHLAKRVPELADIVQTTAAQIRNGPKVSR